MSADLFDLGVRLRAAHTRRVQPRMEHAPVWPQGRLVAALARRTSQGIEVTVRRRGAQPVTATGPRAVSAFGVLGAPSSEFECLVVPDRRQLGLLVEAAHASPPADFGLNRTAGVVEWWGQQAEHPGTRAVVVVTDACRQRWTTGEAPDAEGEVGTWLRWLDVPGGETDPTMALLDLAETVAEAPPLDSFDPKLDQWSWGRLLSSVNGSYARAWRYPDSPMSSALGCRARCDARDHFERALLDDPAWAERERHSGRVVDGTMTHIEDGLRVVTAQEAVRYREGHKVQVSRPGIPEPEGSKPAIAEVTAMSWDAASGARVIDLRWSGKAQIPVGPGVAVRLVPEARSPVQAMRGRTNLAGRFAEATWLTQPRKVAKPLIRRPVPLDVMVAAASVD